ncbi:CAZyme family GT2 [Paecilomyces variotii]|nr:CAZyme family GT2 [Paecilomyces variotii]
MAPEKPTLTVTARPMACSEIDLRGTRPRFSSLQAALKKVADFIQDWTPFLLVASYFFFSTCIYMVCSTKLIEIFWFICLTTNFYIAGNSFVEAFMCMGPARDARKARMKVEANGWVFPTPDDQLLKLDLIIVAYLPNEKDIILDRVHYALEKIVYPKDKITINVVYNTPTPIEPLETELRELAREHSNLRIVQVPNSTSKAHNLNYFLTLDTGSDIIAIFDCDHYTHPYGPRWAIERFMSNPKIDIVQGRCVVFNAAVSFMTGMISVEFDKIYAVSHPGRSALWGFALFTGSNGYWRSPFLREVRMDDKMLTEDIDSSLRSLARGAHIEHDLNVVSYELAPVTWLALWNQRLRWAQGWAAASMRHVILTFNKPTQGSRNKKMRFGLLSLLLIREMSYYLVTQYCCLVLSVIILHFPKNPIAFARLIYFQYPISQWLFIVSAICLVATLWITDRAKSEFISLPMIIMFSILYPIYLVVTAVVGLYGHARQVSKYTSWNTTARG